MEKRIRGGDSQRRQYWEDVVRRWQKGGQTVRAFCQAKGLHESAFYFWRREVAKRKEQGHREGKSGVMRQKASVTKASAMKVPVPKVSAANVSVKQQPPKNSGPSFLPVHVVASASHANDTNDAARGGVEIVLAQGRVVRVVPGFDRQTLADVLSLLEARPC